MPTDGERKREARSRALVLGVALVSGVPLSCQSSKSGAGPGSGSAASAPTQQPAPDLNVPQNRAAPPSGSAPAKPPPPPLPEPLTGNALVPLAVEGFGEATVSVPLGARERRPVVIAMHGNYDRPEWQCQVWREITGGYPWVLCPRGVPRADAPRGADRWTYSGADKLEAELHEGLLALARSYPEHVDSDLPVFTGFSLGAILGVRMLSKKSDTPRYRAAVLVEGGYNGWSVGTAKAFASQGGKRVLFACGQSACQHAGKQAARLLGQQGVEVEVASGGNVGHTYDGPVADAIAEHWDWLTAVDERFASVASPKPAADPTAD